MSYGSIFYRPISSSFVRIPAKRERGAQIPAGSRDPVMPAPLGKGMWLSTKHRAEQQRDRAKVKGGSVGGKVTLHLRAGHNFQD